jgi:hypothetical protein
MLKRIIFIFLGLILCSSFAFAEISKDNLTLVGSLKNEISLRIEGLNNDLSKFKNIVELAGEYQLRDDLVFFLKAKYWYNAVYDFRDKRDKQQHYMGHIQRADWLRDCYLDYTNGPWFLRLGKQQVAWGQADGIQILDRVNPVDLTEYYLPDFVDIRIPLWMANINYSPKLNSNLQLLIIPDFEQSTSAPAYAPFAFRAVNLFENANKFYGWTLGVDTIFPGKHFDNSTFALQWQDRIGDLQYTLNYLYGYYTSARLVGLTSTYLVRSFKLWRMYGGSFNKTFTNPGPLQGITLRGDFAYYNDEPTYYGTDGSRQGFNRWDNVFWLLGIDKTILTDWQLSFQFAQYIMQDAKAGILNYRPLNAYTYGPADQVENIFALKISTDFMNERLKPEISWSATDDNQGKLSPKVTYELKDNLWLTVGIHYFYGNEQDSNGQFRDQSQFYTQVKYTF